MSGARLRLQGLPTQAAQVLVVGKLAEAMSDGSFTPSDVAKLFTALRVPCPSNVNRVLATLRKRNLILALGSGRYAITPLGEQDLLESVGVTLSENDLPSTAKVMFAQEPHATLPAELAPSELALWVQAFLSQHPFENNVFGISRFPDDPDDAADPLVIALCTCRQTVRRFGLEFHIASDRSVAPQLWSNVAASLWSCARGIAIIEDGIGEGLNANVLIEVGAMLMAGRSCALLKSPECEMPTDLVGHIYKPIELSDADSICKAVEDWCRNDLGLVES